MIPSMPVVPVFHCNNVGRSKLADVFVHISQGPKGEGP